MDPRNFSVHIDSFQALDQPNEAAYSAAVHQYSVDLDTSTQAKEARTNFAPALDLINSAVLLPLDPKDFVVLAMDPRDFVVP